MLRMKSVISIMLLFAVLLSGCVEKEQGISNVSTEAQTTPKELMIPENAKKVVELAKNDLAARLKISESSVTVEDVIPEEWPDTSLGYPEPGKEYAQVITPGYVIFLSAEGETYEYHSDYTRIAPPPEPVKEPNEKIPLNISEQSKVVELAKKDLAAKLNIPEAGVQVLRVIPTEWPDASLGYPEPEMVYAQVITPGYVILLQADGTIYEYHSDYKRVVAPPNRTKKD